MRQENTACFVASARASQSGRRVQMCFDSNTEGGTRGFGSNKTSRLKTSTLRLGFGLRAMSNNIPLSRCWGGGDWFLLTDCNRKFPCRKKKKDGKTPSVWCEAPQLTLQLKWRRFTFFVTPTTSRTATLRPLVQCVHASCSAERHSKVEVSLFGVVLPFLDH